MRLLAPLSFLALAACAHAGTASSDPVGWESLYGTYEFEGSIVEDPGRSTAVSGTLRLGDGRYYLTTTQGTCDGRLAPTPRTDLSWGCRDGMSVLILRRGDEIATEGTASIQVVRFVDWEVCHIDSDGTQVCTMRSQRTMVTKSGRITIRKVFDQG